LEQISKNRKIITMNIVIPFLDLKTQYLSIKNEIEQAVLGVLGSSKYALGPEVEKFEKEFATYHDVEHGVAVNSGTSALHLALLAAGVGKGDEVITVSMTFIATAAAISYTGATPVFVDVDPETLTMDPSKIEAKITAHTKAILPVHLYGQAADMDLITEIANRHKLVVIEDAAQAHGAGYKGKRVGGFGHMAAFSFYPGKNLGAYGEGGIVVTGNADFAEKMRILRDWGQEKKYHHDILGYNYRMDAVQGAVLRVKLRRLGKWTELRRSHASQYDSELKDSRVQRTTELHNRCHVYHIYSIFHPERNKLQDVLQKAGIHTGMHYPIPVHLQKPYRRLGYHEGDFPVTEKIAREQLSLPMFPELKEKDVSRVSEAVCNWPA
jgi:dTDP-4-amino-4,6-dideoxygalactose transaminase